MDPIHDDIIVSIPGRLVNHVRTGLQTIGHPDTPNLGIGITRNNGKMTPQRTPRTITDHRTPEVQRTLIPPALDLADQELHSFRITDGTLDDQLILQHPITVSPSTGFNPDSPAGSMTYRLMVVGMMNAPPISTRPMATPMIEVLAWAIR